MLALGMSSGETLLLRLGETHITSTKSTASSSTNSLLASALDGRTCLAGGQSATGPSRSPFSTGEQQQQVQQQHAQPQLASVGSGNLSGQLLSSWLVGDAVEGVVRSLHLGDWGHTGESTGPVAVLAWSPDYKAIAVGYSKQGLTVWTSSGCRLMSTVRQQDTAGLLRQQQQQQQEGAQAQALSKPLQPLINARVQAVAWGALGYSLVFAGEAPSVCGGGLSEAVTGGGLGVMAGAAGTVSMAAEQAGVHGEEPIHIEAMSAAGGPAWNSDRAGQTLSANESAGTSGASAASALDGSSTFNGTSDRAAESSTSAGGFTSADQVVGGGVIVNATAAGTHDGVKAASHASGRPAPSGSGVARISAAVPSGGSFSSSASGDSSSGGGAAVCQLIEVQFARALSTHHRVAQVVENSQGTQGEVHVLKVRERFNTGGLVTLAMLPLLLFSNQGAGTLTGGSLQVCRGCCVRLLWGVSSMT